MSAVATLRARADKLADQLQDAEVKAAAALHERAARNDQRRAGFWADATERCTDARHAVLAARKAVVDHAATGDTVAALAAFGEYVARVAEVGVIVGQAQQATRTYEWTERRQVDPTDTARMGKDGLHAPRMEKHDVRVLAAVWNRDHDGPPPSSYQTTYPAGVHGLPPSVEPFDKLLAEGVEGHLASHRQVFLADFLAPLQAELEPEADE